MFSDRFDLLSQPLNPTFDEASVCLQLLLTRAPCANSTAEALQMGPEPGKSGKEIFVLRQLHLEPSLVRLSASGEDIQDERCAVNDLYPKGLLQIPLLGRGELVVEDDQVVFELLL